MAQLCPSHLTQPLKNVSQTNKNAIMQARCCKLQDERRFTSPDILDGFPLSEFASEELVRTFVGSTPCLLATRGGGSGLWLVQY